jgi:hypothetical protein
MSRVQPHPPIERAELGRCDGHSPRFQNFFHDGLAFPGKPSSSPGQPMKAAETAKRCAYRAPLAGGAGVR